MKTFWRHWFTGGIAAVLAAASQVQAAPDVRALRASRYTAEETVRRIADTARRQGMPVFARLAPAPSRTSAPAGRSTPWLLVLGSDDAHTAVLQASPGAALSLPLTLRVVADDAGGAQVGFTDGRWLAGHDGLPGDLLARVAALPALLDAALGTALDAQGETSA